MYAAVLPEPVLERAETNRYVSESPFQKIDCRTQYVFALENKRYRPRLDQCWSKEVLICNSLEEPGLQAKDVESGGLLWRNFRIDNCRHIVVV